MSSKNQAWTAFCVTLLVACVTCVGWCGYMWTQTLNWYWALWMVITGVLAVLLARSIGGLIRHG